MRNTLLLLILFLSALPLTAAESDVLKKFDFNFNSNPNPHGQKSYGNFRYFYMENLSFSLYFTYENRKTDSLFSGREDSLVVTKTNDYTGDIYLGEYSIGLFNRLLTLRGGLAFNITANTTSEKGYFITSPENPFHEDITETETTNHVFTNNSEVIFYSPKIQAGINLRTDLIKIENTFEYIPIYYLDYEQDTKVSPLIAAGTAEHTYSGWSHFYIKNDIRLLFFNLVEFQYIFEYQKLKFQRLGLDYDGGWVLVSQPATIYNISNHTLMGSLRPDLFADVDIIVGAGVRFLVTEDSANGLKLVDKKEWILNIGSASKI